MSESANTYDDVWYVQRCRAIMRRKQRMYVTRDEVEDLFWEYAAETARVILEQRGEEVLERSREIYRTQFANKLIAALRAEGITVQ